MFDGNWSIGVAFGLVAGIVLAVIGLAWLSGGLPTWWQHDGSIVRSSDSLANWMTAVVGVIATVVSIWAVILLKRTLHQTVIATKATQDAVAVTETMGRLQTQAYVSFNGTELHYILDEGVPISVQVRAKFKNTGQTPGRIVYGFCHVAFLFDLEAAFHQQTARSNPHRNNLGIGPGEVRWIASHPIPINGIAQAIAVHRTLVVYGLVEFTDVFDSVRRVEDFCVGIAFHSDPSKIVNGSAATHDWTTHQDYRIEVT